MATTGQSAKKQWGMTPALSEAEPQPLDHNMTSELVEELKRENNYEPQAETAKRIEALRLLHKVVVEFVKRVSLKQKLRMDIVNQLGGKVIPYGSYRLGVFGPGSDIDTLAVAPRNISRHDFFEQLPAVLLELAGEGAVTQMTAVPDAYVPIIKLVLNGIEIDLIFASITSKEKIESNFNLDSNAILEGLDDSTIKSVTGPRVTDEILKAIPEAKTFRQALRAIKLWAQRRAIYSNIVGFPGGVAWAMLVARVCQYYPKALGGTLVHRFFKIMKLWKWPEPILLKEIEKGPQKVWNPTIYPGDSRNLMPIITPAYPSMCATYNVNQSNLKVIKDEIVRGSQITEEIFSGKAKWSDLFTKHTFFTQDHKYYLSVIATSNSEDQAKALAGAVESKLRHFVAALEQHKAMISLARPYTKGFKRVHKCANGDQIKEVRRGELKYKCEETKIVENTDPDLTINENGNANEETKEEISDSGNSSYPKTIYTTTFYIGINPTPMLEQKKNLDIGTQTTAFLDKCKTWDKYDKNLHTIEVLPLKSWLLPDDVFDVGETKPTKPTKKRKMVDRDADDSMSEAPSQRSRINGVKRAEDSPMTTPTLATFDGAMKVEGMTPQAV